MALQDLDGLIYFPNAVEQIDYTASALWTLDAVNEKIAQVLQAPKSGEIAKVWFHTKTVATGATVTVSIETVDASGDPSGTPKDTNSSATQAIANGDDNTRFAVTLDASCTVTQGDFIAVVITAPGAGSFDIDFARRYAQYDIPYSDFYNGTDTWTKNDDNLLIAIEYDDGSVFPMPSMGLARTHTGPNFNSGSDPDEIGLMFQLPFPCTVKGFWLFSDMSADFTLKFYDSDGSTELTTLSVDASIRGGTTYQQFLFPADVDISKDTNYRITVVPGASNANILTWLFEDADTLKSFQGGNKIQGTYRTDGGSWSEYTDRLPVMGLIISAIDDGIPGTTPVPSGITTTSANMLETTSAMISVDITNTPDNAVLFVRNTNGEFPFDMALSGGTTWITTFYGHEVGVADSGDLIVQAVKNGVACDSAISNSAQGVLATSNDTELLLNEMFTDLDANGYSNSTLTVAKDKANSSLTTLVKVVNTDSAGTGQIDKIRECLFNNSSNWTNITSMKQTAGSVDEGVGVTLYYKIGHTIS